MRRIFKQILAVKSEKIATFHKTIDFQNFPLCYSNGFDLFGNLLPWGFWASPWIWRYLAGSRRYPAAKLKNRVEKGPFSAKNDLWGNLRQSVPLRDIALCSKHFLSVVESTTKVLLTVWQSVHPFGCYRRISGFVLRFEIFKLIRSDLKGDLINGIKWLILIVQSWNTPCWKGFCKSFLNIISFFSFTCN